MSDVRPIAPGAVRWIARTLEEAGYETWAVGGAVRDALMGHASVDWDLATRATPRQVRRTFRRTVPIGIDHGLTFHPDDKLRTVLWGLAGIAVPPGLVAALERARHGLGRRFGRRVEGLLGRRERDALTARVEALLENPVHPRPPTDRPPLPWPPY